MQPTGLRAVRPPYVDQVRRVVEGAAEPGAGQRVAHGEGGGAVEPHMPCVLGAHQVPVQLDGPGGPAGTVQGDRLQRRRTALATPVRHRVRHVLARRQRADRSG
ncbi:hypothetical protein SAV31267_095120 [Streptomyces avermitilis]|uniref:Uncharacterized protein n=1 Tax=Streptomyces avermitilis TaxID=33903 RepID=A0A4D4NA26_STRAX|nr:hypothetical protein SAV31267_095120 [Streptomyces avermitilis]